MHFKLNILNGWLLLDNLVMHDHIVYVCVTVYWAQHLIPIISGDDDDSDDASDVDRYDYMGYGSEYDEWIEDSSTQIRDISFLQFYFEN